MTDWMAFLALKERIAATLGVAVSDVMILQQWLPVTRTFVYVRDARGLWRGVKSPHEADRTDD